MIVNNGDNIARSILEFGTSRESNRQRHWAREKLDRALWGLFDIQYCVRRRYKQDQNFRRMSRKLARSYLEQSRELQDLRLLVNAMYRAPEKNDRQTVVVYQPPSLLQRLWTFFFPRAA